MRQATEIKERRVAHGVVMYTKWGCGYCMLAQRLLAAKGIEVEHVDVTFRPTNFREMVARSGGRVTAPQIFIGDHHVGGYRELVELDRRDELGRLLEASSSTTLRRSTSTATPARGSAEVAPARDRGDLE